MMTSQEMASASKKRAREHIMRDAMEACKLEWTSKQDTNKDGQFLCKKCNTRKTRYYQMQTRSADEPMTTFVTCNNCNNRWKF